MGFAWPSKGDGATSAIAPNNCAPYLSSSSNGVSKRKVLAREESVRMGPKMGTLLFPSLACSY